MSNLNLTSKEINQIVPKKLELKNVHQGRERYGEFWLDGKFQFHVTLPNIHGGTTALSTGFLKQLRKSTFLTTQQYFDLVKCPLTGERYIEIIREMLQKLSEEESAKQSDT